MRVSNDAAYGPLTRSDQNGLKRAYDPRMRLTLPAAILLASLPLDSRAQSVCLSIHFRTAPSASLSATITTRLNLVRQPDGSYTSYETASAAPYTVLSVTPHFERQLASCLPTAPPAANAAPPVPANPVGQPSEYQAVALLKSGGYLIVTPSSVGIDAAVFDQQMNLISEQSYAAGVGLTKTEVAIEILAKQFKRAPFLPQRQTATPWG
jgi:hypothetical protein